MIYELSKNDSIARVFLRELRHIHIQNDRQKFRNNLERMGQVFAYEISKKLIYIDRKTPTVLGEAKSRILEKNIVLATILRAGLPLHQGLLSFFDEADCAYVSAYREHHSDDSFDINMQYVTCPDLTDTNLIISDPMLATGASLAIVIEELRKYGEPHEIHVVTVIAAREGVNYITRTFPDVHLWVGAIDPVLNSKSYIIPGLGDAGDLAFGSKLQS